MKRHVVVHFCQFCHLALNNEYRDGRASTIFECKPAFKIIEPSIASDGETDTSQKSLTHRIHPTPMSQEGFEGLTTAKQNLKNILKYLVDAETNNSGGK